MGAIFMKFGRAPTTLKRRIIRILAGRWRQKSISTAGAFFEFPGSGTVHRLPRQIKDRSTLCTSVEHAAAFAPEDVSVMVMRRSKRHELGANLFGRWKITFV
jgi:hypothetical protein